MKIVKIRRNQQPYLEGFRYAIKFDSSWDNLSFDLEDSLRKKYPVPEYMIYYLPRRLRDSHIENERGTTYIGKEYYQPMYVCFKDQGMITLALLSLEYHNEN